MTDKAGEQQNVDTRSGWTLKAALLLLVLAIVMGVAGATGLAGVFALGAIGCFIAAVILAPSRR